MLQMGLGLEPPNHVCSVMLTNQKIVGYQKYIKLWQKLFFKTLHLFFSVIPSCARYINAEFSKHNRPKIIGCIICYLHKSLFKKAGINATKRPLHGHFYDQINPLESILLVFLFEPWFFEPADDSLLRRLARWRLLVWRQRLIYSFKWFFMNHNMNCKKSFTECSDPIPIFCVFRRLKREGAKILWT